MTTKYFNFNNEADLTPVEVDAVTGEVEFTIDGESATFENLREFAEFYATSRNVLPENLKHWALTEDGDTFAFVLSAATAGLDETAIKAMTEALFTAGLDPEAIGAAIGSAIAAEKAVQGHERPQVEDVKPEDVENLVLSVVFDLYENVGGQDVPSLKLRVLFDHFGVSNVDDLVEELIEDFDDITESYNAYGIEAVRENIHELLRDIEAEYETGGLPFEVAFNVLTGYEQTDAELADVISVAEKAFVAAGAASRYLKVNVVTEDLTTFDAFIESLIATQQGLPLYYVNQRFYIVA